MTKAEIWEAVARQPMTPQGIAERLRLLELVPDDLTEEDRKDEKREKSNVGRKRDRSPNWYHGVNRIELERWIRLRESGVVVERAWWRGDRSTGIRVRLVRLAPPISCVPIPDDYDGRFTDGGAW